MPPVRHPDALSPADSAWLRMEGPGNPMTSVAVAVTGRPVDPAKLKVLIEDRLLDHLRFRQRVLESRLPLRGARWQEVEDFDLADHLFRVELPDPGVAGSLERLVGELAGEPLDLERPLWRIDLVEGVGGGSAIVARAHHCLGDGTALLRVFLGLVDPAPALDEDFGRLVDASDIRSAAVASGWEAKMLARLITLRSDPVTPLKGNLGREKAVAWSGGRSLEDTRRIAGRAGVTVDALLAGAASGALRRHLLRQGVDPKGLTLRALVPVDLRLPEESGLGNLLGLVLLDLPVGVDSPSGRLERVAERLAVIRERPESIVTFGLPETADSAMAEVEVRAVRHLASKATLMLMARPGPARRVRLCGRVVREMAYWLPQTGALGLGISISSYAGRLGIAVASDRGLVPEPAALIEAFEASLSALDGP